MNVGLAILALFLGFLFSFVGVQCAGSTDIKPISYVYFIHTIANLLPNFVTAELSQKLLNFLTVVLLMENIKITSSTVLVAEPSR